MIEFTIPCAAVGKGRPRVTAHGTYTPQKTRDYEQLVRLCFQRSRRKPVTDREKALAVTITAIFRVPEIGRASCRERDSEKKKRELVGKPYTKKPDADNLAKAILDALNGMAYPDDAQIVNLKVRKWYGETDMVHVLIEEENIL